MNTKGVRAKIYDTFLSISFFLYICLW
jgi:hypothetical protein